MNADTPEAKRVAGVRAVTAEAEQRANAARAELESAQAEVARSEQALASAVTAFDDKPGDTTATAKRRAEDAHGRAVRLLVAAQTKDSDAREASDGARQALANAERDQRVATLHDAASPAALAQAIEAPWRTALSSYRALHESAGAIADALAASYKASAELRGHGENSPELDPLHAVAPALDELVRLGVNVHDLDSIRPHTLTKTPAATLFALLAHLDGPATLTPQAREAHTHRLRRLRLTRTSHEADALERHEAREAGDVNEIAKEARRLSAGGAPTVAVQTSHGIAMKHLNNLDAIECGHRNPPRLRRVGDHYKCLYPGCNTWLRDD
jgi:hypothetical protein